jgi:cytochrome c oxidase subunit 1/cytochrome c oxidase subunit I+III
MWDRDDREEDAANLAAGRMVLEEGHETPASTVVDAEWDEVLDMPSHSAWPVVLALALSGIFAFVLLQQWLAAAIVVVVALAILAAWHAKEPQEA